MNQKPVRKAIIPVAGLGTRFLPVTKTIPKEMLPIVDTPAIQYVVEEAVQAGIKDIVFVQGRGKTALEDYFDITFELETKLTTDGRGDLINSLRGLRENTNFISIRQRVALGLGHAVLCARPVVGDEPFVVMLGDEITVSKDRSMNPTSHLVDHYHRTGISAVTVMEVPKADVHKYGVIAFEGVFNPAGVKVTGLIEKPKAEEAPSFFALPGRYVFSPTIFNYLEEAKPTKNGEIQLTDSIDKLAKAEGLWGIPMTARRFDTGSKVDFLRANLELALERPDLREDVLNMLQKLTREATERTTSSKVFPLDNGAIDFQA